MDLWKTTFLINKSMASFDFPTSPSNGQTYSANGIDWIYNGSVWKKDATSGVKGQKGEVGQKGQKGEVGEKGIKGDKGDKGQKGEIGATGGTGGAGSDGDKGQKGESGVNATGTKGPKGEKGEIGPQGGTGGTGQKGSTGSSGSSGDKGQKGDTGPTGGAGSSVPSGGIILWSGAANAIPSGWYLCDGNNGTPNLKNRFVVGAGDSYNVGVTGGFDSVSLFESQIPSHSHGVSLTTGSDSHTHSFTGAQWPSGSGPEQNQSGGPEDRSNFNYSRTTASDSHSHSVSGNTGGTGGGGAHENRPPYYALCYIMKS